MPATAIAIGMINAGQYIGLQAPAGYGFLTLNGKRLILNGKPLIMENN